jgi:hypothetical protein
MSINSKFDAEYDFPRRDLDMAIGVLIALRGCSQPQAFSELAAAVAETRVGLYSISRALVLLAGGVTARFDHRSEAVELWGDLVSGKRDSDARAV